MKYYKDETGAVFAFEPDGSQDTFIPGHLTAITEAEADELRVPPPIPVQAQIDNLEREQMLPRVTREALLATAVTLAAAQGITEPQLYAANIAYRRTKDFNSQIVALRAQL